MRIIISLTLLLLIVSASAQRVTFDDPDLTFSIKKPKGWEVFDDGYVVKVSPSMQDTASTYFSITYFEGAQPYGEIIFEEQLQLDIKPAPTGKTKIAGEPASYFEAIDEKSATIIYTFSKYNQRFELVTKSPITSEHSRQLNSLVRSVKVSKNHRDN
ncbi:hypothetical protein [Ekhidna sp.]|uniref:hypothetical protein n=1 Tax=Ekhidna sp. TaxID=2608089 RepID=UPI003517B9F1